MVAQVGSSTTAAVMMASDPESPSGVSEAAGVSADAGADQVRSAVSSVRTQVSPT